MRNNSTLVILILCSCVGCQSGPRWAWWKSDAAPAGSSIVARSAPGPETATGTGLPSEKATPQTIAARTAAIQAPASQTAATTPQVPSVPAGSSATLANAPLANYPTTTAAATTPSLPPTNAAYTSPPSATSMAGVVVPPAGTPEGSTGNPYDPANYQSTTAAVATTQQAGQPSVDRYGVTSSTDRYAQVTQSAPVADRYAETAASSPNQTATLPTTATPPAAPVTTSSGFAGTSSPPARYAPSTGLPTTPTPANVVGDRYAASGTSPTVDSYTASATPAPIEETVSSSQGVPSQSSVATGAQQASVQRELSQASVNVANVSGQYRPGGTSTYQAPAVEVATRPSAPTQ